MTCEYTYMLGQSDQRKKSSGNRWVGLQPNFGFFFIRFDDLNEIIWEKFNMP